MSCQSSKPFDDRKKVATNIYENAEGRFYLRVQAWNERATGREYVRTWIACAPGMRLAAVERLHQRVHRDLKAGRFVASRYRDLNPQPTLHEAFEDALQQRIEAGIKPGTVKHWHLCASKWLPELGAIPVSELDYYDVREWWSAYRVQAVSPGAANKSLKVLRAVLAHAERASWRPSGANPANAVSTQMDPPKQRGRPITLEDWTRISDWLAGHDAVRCLAVTSDRRRQHVYMGHWAYAVTQVSLAARGAEVCGLRWDDVNWDTNTITMRDTKTAPSLIRPVSPALLSMLAQHRKLIDVYGSAPMQNNDLLFPSYLGKRTTPNNRFRKIFEKALDELKLPRGRANKGWTPHDLRRWGITLLYETGATQRDVMEFVGHSTAEAHQRYLRASPTRLRSLADTITDAAMPLIPPTIEEQ